MQAKSRLYGRRIRGDIGPIGTDPRTRLPGAILAPAVSLTGPAGRPGSHGKGKTGISLAFPDISTATNNSACRDLTKTKTYYII